MIADVMPMALILHLQPSELVGTKVSEYLDDKRSAKRNIAIEDVFIREDGSIASVSGRFVSVIIRISNR